ncbi:MAG: hypothetical protein EA359_04865 [Balneolaceae bacterium]|jgi:TM2 domain-containing membrane protein YozV|nr:MAG: hypothetical protein EA359_04865 [Balneolaceae bacterium]
MNTQERTFHHDKLQKSRDVIAAISSILPGLGHIYKGHIKKGICILIISPIFIWAGLILGFATAGLGLFAPFVYLAWVIWHAYTIEDLRNHPIGII